ncbi:MAG: DNA polymerase III subunit gamma/tau [Candidatus Gracilibacteria bacterium]
MHKTLYLAYRPQNFDQLEGQEHIKQTLKNASKLGKLAHAYLFAGPRGTGKTSTARILAKAINCLNPQEDGNPCSICEICKKIEEGQMVDVIEIDAASNRGIDDIRDLKEKVNYVPNIARKKVYIIDEVHMLSREAFNALLKTLEEPPEHVHFILATTELQKVLPTIISRCQFFQFYPLTVDELKERLQLVCNSEGIKFDEDAIALIAEEARGGARDALSLLEKVAFQSDKLTIDLVSSLLGSGFERAYRDLLSILQNGDNEELFSLLHSVQKRGFPIEQFMRGFLSYVRGEMISVAMKSTSHSPDLLFLMKLSEEVEKALQEAKYSAVPNLPFELRLLKLKMDIPTEIILTKPLEKEAVKEKSIEKKVIQEKAETKFEDKVVISSPKVSETPKEAVVEKTEKKEEKEEAVVQTNENKNDTSSAEGDSSLSLTVLKRDWNIIAAKLSKSIAKLTFGRHSFPREIQNHQLILAVFGSLHMEKAEEHKQALEALLEKEFHVKLRITFKLEKPSDAPAVPHSPAGKKESEKNITMSEKKVDYSKIADFLGGELI